jgi:crotonobetaine/carnitine-CoA ligase
LVEAPISTAYEGEFLRHQVELVQARWAVVDSDLADRLVAIRDRIPLVEGFWVIDQGGQDEAVARLRAAGWGAEPSEALAAAERSQQPEPEARDLTAVFVTSGTTGPSKGVAMPNAHMNFFAGLTRCLTRFTPRTPGSR